MITFGLFFKNTEKVTITAEDQESGVKSVSYYMSDKGMSEQEVKALGAEWTDTDKDTVAFNISEDKSCVVYVKITDNQGNITYISSDGMVFDGTNSAVTGVETIIIEAKDKAGNVSKVTVYMGHHYGTEWKSDKENHWHECTGCGLKSDLEAHNPDGGTVTKEPTKTETGTKTYKCTVCGYAIRTEEIPENNTTGLGNGAVQDNAPQSRTDALKGREPFIKGADGKIGWDVIRTEEEKAQDGTVSLPFTHASDYVIMVSGASAETILGSGAETAGDAMQVQDGETGDGKSVPPSPREAGYAESGASHLALWAVLTGAAALLAAAGALAWKRKRKTE